MELIPVFHSNRRHPQDGGKVKAEPDYRQVSEADSILEEVLNINGEPRERFQAHLTFPQIQ